jgi:hypothetical protein
LVNQYFALLQIHLSSGFSPYKIFGKDYLIIYLHLHLFQTIPGTGQAVWRHPYKSMLITPHKPTGTLFHYKRSSISLNWKEKQGFSRPNKSINSFDFTQDKRKNNQEAWNFDRSLVASDGKW